MNRRDYIRDGYRQLSDGNFYTKSDTDPTEKVANKVTELMQDMLDDKHVPEKNFDFFTKIIQ